MLGIFADAEDFVDVDGAGAVEHLVGAAVDAVEWVLAADVLGEEGRVGGILGDFCRVFHRVGRGEKLLIF